MLKLTTDDGVDVLVEGSDRMLTPSGFGAESTKLPVVLYASLALDNHIDHRLDSRHQAHRNRIEADPLD